MSSSDTPEKGIRSPGQIRQQLKQVLFRHLQKEIRDNFKDTPEACYFNHLTPIGGSAEKIWVCRYDGAFNKESSPRGKICDTRVAGCVNQARACKCRQPYRTKEEIRTDIRTLIASNDRGRIASQYPDVAALMWVLDGVDMAEEFRLVEEEMDSQTPVEKVES